MLNQIRNDKGLVIGFSTTNGDIIKYFHLKKGVVGYYNTSTKRYTRLMTKLGVNFPFGNADYGVSDVVAADKL